MRRLQFETLEPRDLLSINPADYGVTEVPPCVDCSAPKEWPVSSGFHKDMFVDGGAYLTSLRSYAGEYMWLTMDELLTSSNSMIVGTPDDTNGALLYPDGQPRYRIVFVNGGVASKHGKSLGAIGRERFNAFVANGGSFAGSCAGAFITTTESYYSRYYFDMVPKNMRLSGYGTTYHDVVFSEGGPFGSGELDIKNIKHQGGPYFKPEDTDPVGLEYFGEITGTGRNLQGSPYIMAYKPDAATGRVVVQPSHPEYAKDGPQLSLMTAVLEYALDGTVSLPDLKGELTGDVTEVIGDGQYHRWTLDVTEPGTVDITSTATMYVQFESPAHNESYLQKGNRILIAGIGKWHISVFGDHDILNGVEYTMKYTMQRDGDQIEFLPEEQNGLVVILTDVPKTFDTIRLSCKDLCDNLTVTQAAKLLKLSPSVFRNLVSRGNLPSAKIVDDKKMWDRHELEDFIKKLEEVWV